MKPKISVIMPARNVEACIDEAIQSVLAQKGVSYELLIGDDASTDGTWRRIMAHRQDPRVRTWKFKRHRGASLIWNRLIARARGLYVSICDADDVMLPGNLKAVSTLLDRSPSVGVACVYWRFMDGQGRPIQNPSYFPEVVDPDRGWDLLRMGGTHGGAMIRRALVLLVGGYRAPLWHMDGYDLFLRLAEVSEIKMVPGNPYYAVRHRPHYPDRDRQVTRGVRLRIMRDAIRRRYSYQVPW